MGNLVGFEIWWALEFARLKNLMADTDNSSQQVASSGSTSSRPPSQWWRGAVGYQAYILSFADGNADGIGDLAGITEKLEYIKWLGVDILWINPFFCSPGKDHGYDVSDYCAVDPKHGTLDDFDLLVEKAHSLGLYVVVDVVPNHTSSEHPWFIESKSSTDNPKRDWYLWRDPAPDGGPPNNWIAHFGGPAWTLDETTGQYYCHLFLPEQPDLNWRNPGVNQAFADIFRFWCERGADGFRLDVAHALIKHPDFPDNPQLRELTGSMSTREIFWSFDHVHDLDQPDSSAAMEGWKQAVEPYGAMLLGEVYVTEGERFARFVREGSLDLAFHLPPMWANWEPAKLIQEILDLGQHAPDKVSWILSNHDGSRPVTRFGGGARGQKRAFAVTATMFGLGGVPFLFQGEELGLPDAEIDPENLSDPLAVRNRSSETVAVENRDVSRTPMPWEAGATNGFTQAPQAWLKSQPRPEEQTVVAQRANEKSWLYAYRRLIQMRKDFPQLWQEPPSHYEVLTDEVLLVERKNIVVVANLSENEYLLSEQFVEKYSNGRSAGHNNDPGSSDPSSSDPSSGLDSGKIIFNTAEPFADADGGTGAITSKNTTVNTSANTIAEVTAIPAETTLIFVR